MSEHTRCDREEILLSDAVSPRIKSPSVRIPHSDNVLAICRCSSVLHSASSDVDMRLIASRQFSHTIEVDTESRSPTARRSGSPPDFWGSNEPRPTSPRTSLSHPLNYAPATSLIGLNTPFLTTSNLLYQQSHPSRFLLRNCRNGDI